MTVLEIIKVVGFATGAALHLYFGWLIWRRSRQYWAASQGRRGFPGQWLGGLFAGLTGSGVDSQTAEVIGSERTFVGIGLCLGFWFLGNLLITVQEILLGPGRAERLLRTWSSIAVIGIALFPSVLLHSHIAFWSWMDNYQTLSRRKAKIISGLFYIPMVVLPFTVYWVNRGDYKPYLVKLHWVLVPYSIWFALALWSAAVVDWIMKDRLYEWAVRERAFLGLLSVLLFLNGAAEPLVIGVGSAGPNDFLWITFILLSLAPTFTVAYYIYRYNLYELVIKRSIVYATLAVVFLAVYNYGVKHLDGFLVGREYVRPGVVEGLLVLAMVALAGPLARAIDGSVRRLFVREIEMYRDVVRQVGSGRWSGARGQWSGEGAKDAGETSGGAGTGESAVEERRDAGGSEGRVNELESFVTFAEETIRRGLGLKGVRIIPFYPGPPDEAAERIGSRISRNSAGPIESDEDVMALGSNAAYPLNREGRLLGLMLVAADPGTLVSDKRAVLEVLAGQVASGIESAVLIEDKLRLERELARRERLAALGQMAATVAHEVKNPLSAIKSIAQVMREDSALGGYGRDLDLIIGEINRLSSTVSQLLAFSRSGSQPVAGGSPVKLQNMIEAALAVLRADAETRGVQLDVSSGSDCTLSGREAEALTEVLMNLVLNAVQASPPGGRVSINTSVEAVNGRLQVDGNGRTEGRGLFKLSISDEGPGIPATERSKIFEPFYTTKPRGTGLGLAIVRRRINEMNGTLDIVSPGPEGGATFIVKVGLAE
jgi:signal transduction histidine kinase